jgi:hypothetical protein
MKRRLMVLITLVLAQLAITAGDAMAGFPWPIIGGG